MTVHVEQAVSDVALEPEAQTAEAAAEAPEWAELEQWRAARDQARRVAERTRAEALSD